MMRPGPPSLPHLLQAWEGGLEQGPAQRGLALLGAACPGEDAEALAALSIGERDRRLLGLRAAVFGRAMTGVIDCPKCTERLEFPLDAQALRMLPPAVDAPLSIEDGDWRVALRLPDSTDLIAAAAAPAQAADIVFARSVRMATHAGTPVAPGDLPAPLRATAAERLAAADPQADLRLGVTCAGCGHGWKAPFDIAAFLWAEIDAWAGRILTEVHALAAAYGWAERDILALSPARRRHYLRLVGA